MDGLGTQLNRANDLVLNWLNCDKQPTRHLEAHQMYIYRLQNENKLVINNQHGMKRLITYVTMNTKHKQSKTSFHRISNAILY